MQKELYVFRHGETNMNASRRWQGRGFNLSLNQTGLQQAYELAESLRGHGLEEIYTSPLQRARQTAEIVSGILGLPFYIRSDLIEGSFGLAEGKTKEEIEALYPERLSSWLSGASTDNNVCFPNGETKQKIRKRFLKALHTILKTTPAHKIGISAHSAVIRFGLGIETVEHGIVYHFCLQDNIFKRIFP